MDGLRSLLCEMAGHTVCSAFLILRDSNSPVALCVVHIILQFMLYLFILYSIFGKEKIFSFEHGRIYQSFHT